MVAVIAGNGLGLLGTSLQQLGLGPGGQLGLGQSGASQYVNVATGNLVLQGQDERLIEQGLLAGLVRTYNSLGTTSDLGGAGGWYSGTPSMLSSHRAQSGAAEVGAVNTATALIPGSDNRPKVYPKVRPPAKVTRLAPGEPGVFLT